MTTKELDVTDVIHDLCSNWKEWSDKLNNTDASLFDLVRQKYPNTKGIYLAVESVGTQCLIGSITKNVKSHSLALNIS